MQKILSGYYIVLLVVISVSVQAANLECSDQDKIPLGAAHLNVESPAKMNPIKTVNLTEALVSISAIKGKVNAGLTMPISNRRIQVDETIELKTDPIKSFAVSQDLTSMAFLLSDMNAMGPGEKTLRVFFADLTDSRPRTLDQIYLPDNFRPIKIWYQHDHIVSEPYLVVQVAKYSEVESSQDLFDLLYYKGVGLNRSDDAIERFSYQASRIMINELYPISSGDSAPEYFAARTTSYSGESSFEFWRNSFPNQTPLLIGTIPRSLEPRPNFSAAYITYGDETFIRPSNDRVIFSNFEADVSVPRRIDSKKPHIAQVEMKPEVVHYDSKPVDNNAMFEFKIGALYNREMKDLTILNRSNGGAQTWHMTKPFLGHVIQVNDGFAAHHLRGGLYHLKRDGSVTNLLSSEIKLMRIIFVNGHVIGYGYNQLGEFTVYKIPLG